MNMEQLTLKVAVLEVRARQLKDQAAEVRKRAEAFYAEQRKAGIKNLAPRLPGGIEAGTVAIKAGRTDVMFDEPVLLEFVRETDPANVEEYVDPGALADKRVLDLLREQLPEFVAERVNPARRAELAAELAEKKDGTLLSTRSGELVKLANVFANEPTGEFAYTPGKKGTAAILAALAAGTVTEDGEIPGARDQEAAADEAPAIPGPGTATGPVAEDVPGSAEDVPGLGAPFADEHGFLNPELAAAHAVVVQGGFSTPPVEAYRMIRDGGVGAERATRWLVEHGLDPEDPRRGKDTPWPLPAPEGGEPDA